jgi:hypothetical protein
LDLYRQIANLGWNGLIVPEMDDYSMLARVEEYALDRGCWLYEWTW